MARAGRELAAGSLSPCRPPDRWTGSSSGAHRVDRRIRRRSSWRRRREGGRVMSAVAASQPWLLAIDTSTEQAGIALTDGSRTAETSWWAGRDQTVTVLAQIDRLVDLVGINPGEIAAIAVATGPGMFNGLRVGMSIAKGWHLGSGAVLIGVSTFDITTEPYSGLGLPVIATIAAGRGRLVWRFDSPG